MSTDQAVIKRKLLNVATTGRFATFTPQEINNHTKQLKSYLQNHQDKLDSIELFQLFELDFYLSLITGHDIEAKAVLERLNDQFGNKVSSQRIKLLKSIYFEAIGDLKSAGEILSEDPDELQLSRRLTTMSRHADDLKYINNLVYYLNLAPGDVVAWCELADEYAKLKEFSKAIHCLKRVLVIEPDAYTVFNKIALLYRLSSIDSKKDKSALLQSSVKEYLRSIDINKNNKSTWEGLYSTIHEMEGSSEKETMMTICEREINRLI
ncbi:oca3 [Candida margitis]|uniref:oca3 n=1 Tax=Candida margitis TaxID=1775924 RepID=UPI002226FA28|nr:oca3 [Candida margitis]KAI5967199.1 oca3 [Candida margitis]